MILRKITRKQAKSWAGKTLVTIEMIWMRAKSKKILATFTRKQKQNEKSIKMFLKEWKNSSIYLFIFSLAVVRNALG